MHRLKQEIMSCLFSCSYPALRLHYNGMLVLLGDQHTGSKGGFDHVNNKVIGKDIQLLHLVPRHVCIASNAIPV